ncbi:MAG: GH36-type glycosyl hydrolase domain-containing protein [Opitutales bacterium]
MQYGHFDDDAREYVITRPDTPRSWPNYLGSTEYGAIITNNAGGYSFYRSAADGRFTRLRFNNIPMDQPGRYFYLRDRESGDFWSSSWQPTGKPLEDYQTTCRHGTAYTVITSMYAGIKTESTYFVPLGQKFEYWRLKVSNPSDVARQLTVFTYCEFANNWRLDQDTFNLQYTQYIGRCTMEDGLIRMAVNDHLPEKADDPDDNHQGQRSWMGLVGADVAGYDLSREVFVGAYGSYAAPDIVKAGACSGSEAYGDNACGVYQVELELEPGESKELLVLLGVGEAREAGQCTLAEWGSLERATDELEKLKQSWHAKLGSLLVQTPDAEFDSMVNVWNVYNCLISYAWSRSASLVYNGERNGLGFRDTVQDILAVLPVIPEEAKARLELMLTGQFANGGALPVVKPFSHRPGSIPVVPKEEFRSDDCLWFFNTVPAYIAETGDWGFLEKVLPYADAGEASVFGHLRRALEFNLERVGQHGLPCGLKADWNDCLRLGYYGESLFVAFQLRLGLKVYGELAEKLARADEVAWAKERLADLDGRIQKHCWSQDRFIWAIGQDGTVYGTHDASEGALYLNTQVWSVISGAATPEQAETCMQTLHEMLATEYGVMLCAPPVTTMSPEIMLAILFNPGTKENAGIFNHPQGWCVMAEAMLGNGDRAYQYHRAYMPSAFNDKAEIRGSEPYVHCQSTHAKYSPMFGAARIPWLSGTATWAYYSSTQYILGFRPELDGIHLDPCLPRDWPGFSMQRLFRGKRLQIEVKNPDGVMKGVKELRVDDVVIAGNVIDPDLLKDGSAIAVTMG